MARGSDAASMLRPGLLGGVRALLAGACRAGEAGLLATLSTAFAQLGAQVECCAALSADGALDEDAIQAAVGRAAASTALDRLVLDGGALFAAAGGGRAGMRVCLEAAWCVTHAVANAAFIPAAEGARIIYIAPATGTGEHAQGACAGLENLARTLSVEWARHRITTVAIAPGQRTQPGQLAALAAYLASPAGAYFSGCLLDLAGSAAALR